MKVTYPEMIGPEVLYQDMQYNKKFTTQELANYVNSLEKKLDEAFDKLKAPQYAGVQVTLMFRREPETQIGEIIAGGGNLAEGREFVIRHFQNKYKRILGKIKEYRNPTRLGIEVSVIGHRDAIKHEVDAFDAK